MRGFLYGLFLALLALSVVSCKTTPPPPPSYERNAVQLHLVSDPNLNLFGGIPHTVVLCVYQLRDPNAFNQAMDEKEGLVKLLECNRFDPSVTYVKKVVVQPRQELTEPLDRAEGTRYVGVVAGYSQLQKERVTRFYAIPFSVFGNPKPLDIDLYLGPQEIQEPRAAK